MGWHFDLNLEKHSEKPKVLLTETQIRFVMDWQTVMNWESATVKVIRSYWNSDLQRDCQMVTRSQ